MFTTVCRTVCRTFRMQLDTCVFSWTILGWIPLTGTMHLILSTYYRTSGPTARVVPGTSVWHSAAIRTSTPRTSSFLGSTRCRAVCMAIRIHWKTLTLKWATILVNSSMADHCIWWASYFAKRPCRTSGIRIDVLTILWSCAPICIWFTPTNHVRSVAVSRSWMRWTLSEHQRYK